MIKPKFDPHNHEKYYLKWKEKGMPLKGLNKPNTALLVNYLNDMEIGKNIALGSKKGARGYGRLRNQKSKIYSMFILIQSNVKKNISDLNEDDLLNFFNDMKKGKYKSPRTNRVYTSVGTYVTSFKSFWHWYMKISKKNKILIEDITTDLDTKVEKPKFNYFTADQLKVLCNHAKFYYKVLMMFLFDTGIRAPTELMNIKVSDLEKDKESNYYLLNIRDEISKTFGRRIKLMSCSDVIEEYIKEKKLKKDDFLFTKTPQRMNEYISNLGYKHLKFGKPVEKSDNGKVRVTWVNKGITMYDFRHSSCCYWLPRYKSESALKYRFGWKKSDMIHYYTELLGMKDTISEEDLYVDITKTDLEKDIVKQNQNITILKEQNESLQKDLKNIKDNQVKEKEQLKTEMKKMKETLQLLIKANKVNRFYDSNK